MQAPIFLTLGPDGTNHELVARRYLALHQLHHAHLVLIDNFFDGLKLIDNGSADYMIQTAVHPDCTNLVADAHFKLGIHIVDTFISPSKALAILTQSDISRPRSLALQPATQRYTDTTSWQTVIPVPTISQIAAGLLERDYDSGLAALEVHDANPGRFRIDRIIGTVDDPWLVFGRHGVCHGNMIAWPESPVAKQFARFPAK